jgi:hypothetical protein
MTIEITKGIENPVTDFFSSTSNTPETDHLEDQLGSAARLSHPIIWKHARQLERERDEAREKYDTLAVENMLEVNKICKERDEAIEILRQIKASDWKTSGELRGMARIF